MLGLPKNIFLMSIVMSLSFTTTAMIVLVAGLLGAAIAPSPKLATLPIAVGIIGTACATIPAALLMQRIGRKAGMAVGIAISLFGTFLAYHSAMTENFWLFTFATFCIGLNAAFIQQGRFIIIENAANQQQQADGLSLALLANLFAAILGPQLGAYGKDLIASPVGYAGSFLLAVVVSLLALVCLCFYKNIALDSGHETQSKRRITTIAKQPVFIIAAGSAAIGYGVMALIMTATPLSMHQINGHSLQHTTLVIQSHIVAMFLPSLLSSILIKKGLRASLIFIGLGLYVIVSLIAFNGVQVLHYWWALVLLGIGWNLLFLTSTTLLPMAYQNNEGFKTQALNDFLVFTSQAIAAFSAGWLLFNFGWHSLLWTAVGLSSVWALIVSALKSKVSLIEPEP